METSSFAAARSPTVGNSSIQRRKYSMTVCTRVCRQPQTKEGERKKRRKRNNSISIMPTAGTRQAEPTCCSMISETHTA